MYKDKKTFAVNVAYGSAWALFEGPSEEKENFESELDTETDKKKSELAISNYIGVLESNESGKNLDDSK